MQTNFFQEFIIKNVSFSSFIIFYFYTMVEKPTRVFFKFRDFFKDHSLKSTACRIQNRVETLLH